MTTDVLEKTDTTVDTQDGEHDRFAHYFNKTDIEAAYLEGVQITALCGKTDVPTRDFMKYPVCKTCEELWNAKTE